MKFMDIFSSSQEKEINTGPWAAQQPYLKKQFSEAEQLYDQGGPQYYPDSTLAQRNPLIGSSEDAMMGYAGGDQFRNMMDKSYQSTTDNLGGGYFGYNDIFNDPNVGGAYTQALSGDPNPYTGEAARAVRDDMSEDYWGVGGTAGQIRGSQINSGQYGGSSRGDLMNRKGLDDLDENQRNVTAQMYNQSYGDAQNRMLSGMNIAEGTRAGMGGEDLSRYGTAMGYVPQQYGMEMGAYGVPGQVGYDRQAYNQAEIDADRQRWDFDQSRDYRNLDWYQGKVGGNYGTSGTITDTSSPSPYSVGKGLFSDATGLISGGMGLFGGGGGGNPSGHNVGGFITR